MGFIKKGNVRIRKDRKGRYHPPKLKIIKESPYISKQEEKYLSNWGHCTVHISPTWKKIHGVDSDGNYIYINKLKKKLSQTSKLKEQNKRLINVLELGVTCMERNWFEEIPGYVKNYLTIAKAAITNKPEEKK